MLRPTYRTAVLWLARDTELNRTPIHKHLPGKYHAIRLVAELWGRTAEQVRADVAKECATDAAMQAAIEARKELTR